MAEERTVTMLKCQVLMCPNRTECAASQFRPVLAKSSGRAPELEVRVSGGIVTVVCGGLAAQGLGKG